MKVLLVGNYAPDRQESMQRFAEVLHGELKARGHEVELLRPPTRLNAAGAPPTGKAKWLGYVDKFILFPSQLRKAARRFDIVHICDHSNGPYLRVLRYKRHLLTCNDVLAIRSAKGLIPHSQTGWSGKILQRYILNGINRSRMVACISENTRRELLEVSTLTPARTHVIYMGLNYPYMPMPQAEARQVVASLFENAKLLSGAAIPAQAMENFVFHVGGNQWYKNREGVLRIYAELRALQGEKAPYMVMAGKPFTEAMLQIVREKGLEDSLITVQGVSNEELRALYSLARAMMFPSLAEGFGWPVVEAQACGCPVVTSNFAPLTEIGGDVALYGDPKDHKAMANHLATLLNEKDAAHQKRVEASLQNAQRFTTASMIEAYEELYTQISSGKNSPAKETPHA